jgi:tetratricopeptide (TPR) repeat protein
MDSKPGGAVMVLRIFVFVLVLLTGTIPARADWHEASSDHFLVIADQNEKDVREFAERLERFHGALLYVLGREDTLPSPSNRVTIYVVRNANQVRKLAGDKSGYLQGFYNARAGGSVAFTPRVESEGRDITQSEQVLLHEYTHHVMHSVSEWATPRWLSEGFAEFFSTARFEKDGGVGLGLPAMHRAGELFYAKNVPIEALLDSETYQKRKTKAYDEFYGRSWLLYHYLQLSGKRTGQLGAYRNALANGATELQAANTAFGDLKTLDKELGSYLNQSKMSYLKIPPDTLKTGAIVVRQMREAEGAIMPIVLESKRGVDSEMAKALLPRAQAIAAKHPDDPAVLAALAEAEHDAGNLTAALAAADKAIAASPTLVNAHVQKIYALARIAEGADDPELAWKAVRKAVTALNKIENDHPIPLIYYYQSLQASGKDISEIASQGLERALVIAPFDQNVRWQVVQQFVDEKQYGLAYRTLMPLANDPHNRSDDNPAIALLAEIKQKWEAATAEKKAADEAKAAPAKATK